MTKDSAKPTILAAVDFTAYSWSALRQAARLAEREKACLHALHVIESQTLSELADAMHAEANPFLSESMQKAQKKLDEWVKALELPEQMEVVADVHTGDAYEQLMEHQRRLKADWLVLGSRGRDAAQGTVSVLGTQAIRKADARVLIVRQEHDDAFRHICAFVDFSKKAISVLEEAIEMAQQDGATLQICHIHLPPWAVHHYKSPTLQYSEEDKKKYQDKLMRRMDMFMAPLEDKLKGLEVEYELIENSEKVLGIDAYIEKWDMDLVVVSTRKRTVLNRWILMRTVAEHIVRTSPCSVLSVKV